MNGTSWKIWIDTGGTFTDCIAVDPSGHARNLKVLSSGILRSRIKGTAGTKVRIDLPLSLAVDFFKGFKIKVGEEIRTVVYFSPSLNEITVDRSFRHVDAEGIAEIYTGEEVPI